METKVSVALCTYNGAEFLASQLDSIARQTVLPAEIVACDDGSTDETLEILEAFQLIHREIPMRIHRNGTHLGAARNFFQTVRLCREELVLLSDQDDVWLSDRVACFLDSIDPLEDDVMWQSDGWLVSGMVRGRSLFQAYRVGERDCRQVANGRAGAVVARKVFLTGAGLALRRSFLLGLPEPAAPFLHDEWLGWFAGGRIDLIPVPTFLYRQHSGQQTGVDPSLRAQFRRLTAPQAGRAVTLEQGVAKFAALAEVAATVVDFPNRKRLAGKNAFLAARVALHGRGALRRAAGVVGLALSGRYRSYGDGWRTAVKDLLGKDLL